MFKYKMLLILLVASVSCKINKNKYEVRQEKEVKKVIVSELNEILESKSLTGSIVIFDNQNSTYYSNSFENFEKGYLPASTFKIPNAIIAFELGTIKDENFVFAWDGNPRRIPIWNKEMTFREAFHMSCVPCFQELARKAGPENMNKYLKQFNYGEMLVDSNNIDRFWLEGDSKISQKQQIDFLRDLYFSKLGVSKVTEEKIKKLIFIEETEYYKLSGKTGWAIRDNNNTGWFVGYLKTSNNIYFFATRVEPDMRFDMNLFPIIRSEVTLKAFKTLDFIK